MFGRTLIVASALALGSLAACGGGDLDVYNADPNNASTATNGTNTGAPDGGSGSLDMGGTPDPNNVGTPEDMGGGDPGMPDMERIDMTLPDPDPTTNVPQQGPTVGSQVTGSCSTIAVKGLSIQLIDQMNCLDPGVMKSFEGAPGISYGASVFPFQQGPATDALTAVAANNAGTMPINSALRTLPQQYLLYEWYNRGLCNANLAAAPGASNHNGGLAVDIGNSATWRTPMRNTSYIDNVSGEPWHFYFSGAGGKDVRNLSVLAFQQLYNYNFPENPITEDGAYGPQTEGALVGSPAEGFTAQPRCEANMALVAYPHRTPLDVKLERVGEGLVGIRTLAPHGVRLIEYYVDGVLAGYADGDAVWFESVLAIGRGDGIAEIEVVAYDRAGAERGRVRGAVETRAVAPVFVRPMGGGNYEILVEDIPNGVQFVDFFVNGIPVEQEEWLATSDDRRRRLSTQLRGNIELGLVLFDAKERIVDMRTLELAL